MIARWFTFLALGLSVWWHTRPRLLLVAALAMLVGFLGIAFRPGDFLPSTLAIDLAAILFAQLVLGIALGLIYTASLYFGMVLSEGATEHGGYHEALIGLGSVLGPGSGNRPAALPPIRSRRRNGRVHRDRAPASSSPRECRSGCEERRPRRTRNCVPMRIHVPGTQ